jgi:hypothetical protein
MSFIFHTSDGLPDAVAMVLARQSDRTIVVINYALVELMSPVERLEMLNALLGRMDDGPPADRRLDELAAPRRARSRRERDTQTAEPDRTDPRANDATPGTARS